MLLSLINRSENKIFRQKNKNLFFKQLVAQKTNSLLETNDQFTYRSIVFSGKNPKEKLRGYNNNLDALHVGHSIEKALNNEASGRTVLKIGEIVNRIYLLNNTQKEQLTVEQANLKVLTADKIFSMEQIESLAKKLIDFLTTKDEVIKEKTLSTGTNKQLQEMRSRVSLASSEDLNSSDETMDAVGTTLIKLYKGKLAEKNLGPTVLKLNEIVTRIYDQFPTETALEANQKDKFRTEKIQLEALSSNGIILSKKDKQKLKSLLSMNCFADSQKKHLRALFLNNPSPDNYRRYIGFILNTNKIEVLKKLSELRSGSRKELLSKPEIQSIAQHIIRFLAIRDFKSEKSTSEMKTILHRMESRLSIIGDEKVSERINPKKTLSNPTRSLATIKKRNKAQSKISALAQGRQKKIVKFKISPSKLNALKNPENQNQSLIGGINPVNNLSYSGITQPLHDNQSIHSPNAPMQSLLPPEDSNIHEQNTANSIQALSSVFDNMSIVDPPVIQNTSGNITPISEPQSHEQDPMSMMEGFSVEDLVPAWDDIPGTNGLNPFKTRMSNASSVNLEEYNPVSTTDAPLANNMNTNEFNWNDPFLGETLPEIANSLPRIEIIPAPIFSFQRSEGNSSSIQGGNPFSRSFFHDEDILPWMRSDNSAPSI